MRELLLLLIAGAAAAAPSRGSAQTLRGTPRLIGVGDRVRVRVDEGRPPTARVFSPKSQQLIGTVQAIASDTLYLNLSSICETVAIPRTGIQGVQLSLGRPSRLASALDLGSGGALLFGLFLPSFIVQPERRFGPDWRAPAASAAIGLGAGALLGALRPFEHWRFARIPE